MTTVIFRWTRFTFRFLQETGFHLHNLQSNHEDERLQPNGHPAKHAGPQYRGPRQSVHHPTYPQHQLGEITTG
jgi:hypothetical protein